MPKKKERPDLGFEMTRKFFHSLALGYLVAYWIAKSLFNHQVAMLILLLSLITFIVIEFFRIKQRMKIPLFHFLWRPKEENSLGGQVYFVLGIIIALGIFDTKIAVTSILMTVFGDMAAALFGIKFGKHWINALPETAWEGVIAEFLVDLIIAVLLLENLIVAIPMAIMATTVETIFPHVDDNLAIPVFAGFLGQGLFMLFG